MILKSTYQGQLLVAHPHNPRDALYRSVILVVAHSDIMSVGLQINKPIAELTLQKVADTIGVWYSGDEVIYSGGNVGLNKIHVIHSLDWIGTTTVKLNEHVGVTNDISVLAALSAGEGPEHFRACAGYRFWDLNLLDSEISNRGTADSAYRWEVAPATIENIFCLDGARQWENTVADSVSNQVSNWF